MRAEPSVASHIAARGDVLRWPVVGRVPALAPRAIALQLVLLALPAPSSSCTDSSGPDLAPANLATVLTWVHYRGLLVVALLAAGNLFCAGCPFVLVRDWGRRLHAPIAARGRKRLRGKWIAIVLFVAVLFAYELFDLWALPRGDRVSRAGVLWRGACRRSRVQGRDVLQAPLPDRSVQLRRVDGVAARTADSRSRRRARRAELEDCIAGRRAPEAPLVVVQRGCELGLFLPAKVGNLDCTFCLDCVQACPHDNIALTGADAGLELADERRRSGIGRLATRPDLALLSVLFVFGAMLNAFAMVCAGASGRSSGSSAMLGTTSEFVCPRLPVRVRASGSAGRACWPRCRSDACHAGGAGSLVDVATRYAYAFVPFGFGMWLAHYGFHFLTGALTVVPVTQSAAVDLLGWPALGEPLWRWAGMRPGAVFPIQLGCILLGTIGSLASTHLISLRDYPTGRARDVRRGPSCSSCLPLRRSGCCSSRWRCAAWGSARETVGVGGCDHSERSRCD